MSPSALIVSLAMYPAVFLAGPIVFFSVWPEKRLTLPDVTSRAATEAENAATARLGVSLPLFLYGSLIAGTLLWEQFFPFTLYNGGFHTTRWLSNVLLGGYLGVSWAGISIWLLALGTATGRMRREIPGLMAPLKMQITVWLAGAVAEEMWRVQVR